MAGLGSSWGSREEFLHPRDRRGRFRKKWKMADGVIDSISKFLERFSPRTFQSDGQAAQYLFNRAKPGRFGGGNDYPRLHSDYDEANEHLRSGDIDEPTKKFVKMMDDSAVELDSEVILSRTVGPEAFGLTAQNMGAEDGGIEDFTGRLIADRGYSAANIGTPIGHGPGKITMSIAVPKGTKAMIPARSQNDRGIFLDRDQEYRITKVESDGRGGFYAMAIATPRTPGQTPEPLDRGPRGAGLTPEEREARILRGKQITAQRMRQTEPPPPAAPVTEAVIPRGEQPAPQQPTPAAPQQPAAPGEPPPRNEPILKESVGGTSTQGKSTAEIAETPPPETPAVPEAPAPEAPARNIRQAVKDAGVPSPSEGARRRQWNNAYLGVATGKKDPGDMLRELESDINANKANLRDKRERGTDDNDPSLEADIDAQEKLADVIAQEYGLERTKPAAAPAPPAKKAAPGGATPIAEATGTRRRELPGEAGTREVTNIRAFKTAKTQQIQEREERKRRLLSPEPPPLPPVPPKKTPAKKATVTSLAEARAQKLTPEQRRQVADLSPEEQNSYRGFRGKGMTHEDALQSARDAVGARNAREADRANKALVTKAVAKKATGRMTLAEAKRRTAIDAIKDNKIEGEGDNSYKNILRNVGDGTWTPVKARQEARSSAKYWRTQADQAKGFGRATPEERERIQDKNNAIADKYDKLVRDLQESESVTKTDKYRGGSQEGSPAVSPAKKAAPSAPEALPETSPGSGKVRMSQLRAGVPILVQRSGDNWVPATKKTGATRITVQEINPVTGRGGQRQVVGVDDQGNRVEVQSRANVQTFFLAPEKAATGKPSREDRVAKLLLDKLPPDVRKDVLEDMPEADRREVEAGVARVEAAGPPVKKVAKKAAPDTFKEFIFPRDQALLDAQIDKEIKGINDDLNIEGASPKATVTRIRARMKRMRLQPAGEGETLHYIWKRPGGDVRLDDTSPTQDPEIAAARRLAAAAVTAEKSASVASVTDIDRMTVPELKKLAKDELVSLTGLTRKQQIKDAILRNRESGSGGVSTAGAEVVAGPGVLERMAGGPTPDLDKMTKAELLAEAGRRGLTARQSWTKDLIKATIKAGPEMEERRRRVAPKKGTSALIPPVEPNAPAAQKLIQAPDRKADFEGRWVKAGAVADLPDSAAGRSIAEVRDDVAGGRITPDEGIRRLETDIDLNKADLAEVERDLRGLPDPGAERSRLLDERDKLRAGIKSEENASKFMRDYFRKAPAVTPKEIEVQLDPEAAKLINDAGPDDIREAARVGGYRDLKGDTKDELLQDLVKKIAAEQLEMRAANKRIADSIAAKKLAPAPLVTKKSGDPDYVDARLLAEGLDMDEADLRLLKQFQDDLDGKNGRKTPAAVGREMENWAKGPGGPFWERVVHGQITLEKAQDRVAGREPSLAGPEVDREDLAKAEAKDAALKARGDRWLALAERLQKTRRRPARKATEPAPEKPALTPEEKVRVKRAAVILGVPNETLQKRALARKVEAAPPPEAAKSVIEQMRTMQSREEGQAFLKNRTKAELQEIAKAAGMPYASKDTKGTLISRLVEREIGGRLEGEALRSLPQGGKPEPTGPAAPGIRPKIRAEDILPPAPEVHEQGPQARLEGMSPAELADLENELGIKRTSLDRGDRIAAIRARQADQERSATVARSLPTSGRQWNWETIADDGGVMHGDSASMNLAQKLRKAGREEDARYVADMRLRISSPTGDHSPDDVEKMVRDLKAMMEAERDPGLQGAYRRALDNIDAPESPVPDMPESAPPALRRMMNELNQIPVARRTGHFAGTTKKVSAVDRLAELIRKIESGNGGSIGTVQSELRSILRSFHESVDGAYQMWRLESLIDEPDIKTWIRSFY